MATGSLIHTCTCPHNYLHRRSSKKCSHSTCSQAGIYIQARRVGRSSLRTHWSMASTSVWSQPELELCANPNLGLCQPELFEWQFWDPPASRARDRQPAAWCRRTRATYLAPSGWDPDSWSRCRRPSGSQTSSSWCCKGQHMQTAWALGSHKEAWDSTRLRGSPTSHSGRKDHINIRILHSGCRAQDKGDSRNHAS